MSELHKQLNSCGPTVKAVMARCETSSGDYVVGKVPEMQLPRNRKWGRPKGMYLDVMNEDMLQVGSIENEMCARSV